jgi:hypothetical protein
MHYDSADGQLLHHSQHFILRKIDELSMNMEWMQQYLRKIHRDIKYPQRSRLLPQLPLRTVREFDNLETMIQESEDIEESLVLI